MTNLRAFRPQAVLALLLLFVVTFTLYLPFWFLRQDRALRATPGARLLPRFLPYAFMTGAFVSMAWVVPEVLADDAPWAIGTGRILNWIDLGLYLVLLFELRARLNELASARHGDKAWLSGVLTWLLGPFYLQYKMNRLIPNMVTEGTATPEAIRPK